MIVGIHLVAWALTTPIKAPSRTSEALARLTLVAMASHAVDRHAEPWYSGGSDFLCDVLNTNRAATVTRSLAVLRDNNLIERSYETSDGAPLSRSKPARWVLRQ